MPDFNDMVACINCKIVFPENEIIYDGDLNTEICPYCKETNCIANLTERNDK